MKKESASKSRPRLIKAVIARQLANEIKKNKIPKQRMAQLMKTSRAQVDRLLDPDNGSATIETLQRAPRIVGRTIAQTAKLNDVNPEAYLRNTLVKIADGNPLSRIDELMPWNIGREV
jgi:predicted transcriptional regulator